MQISRRFKILSFSLFVFSALSIAAFSHPLCLDATRALSVPRHNGKWYIGDVLSAETLALAPVEKQVHMIEASNFIRQLLGDSFLRIARNKDGSLRQNNGIPVVVGVEESGPVIVGVNDIGHTDFMGTFGAEIYNRVLEASQAKGSPERFSVRMVPMHIAEIEGTRIIIFIWDAVEQKVLFVATPPGGEELHEPTLAFAHRLLEHGFPPEYHYEQLQ